MVVVVVVKSRVGEWGETIINITIAAGRDGPSRSHHHHRHQYYHQVRPTLNQHDIEIERVSKNCNSGKMYVKCDRNSDFTAKKR